MKAPLKFVALAAGAAVATALFATCGGGGTDTSGEEATIDVASVETAIDELATFIPVCNPGSSLRAPTPPKPAPEVTAVIIRLLKLGQAAGLRVGGNPGSFLDPDEPADELGDCGGRITFPAYSHSSGTTTATLEFDNFCTLNEDTGERNITDGTVSLVDHGTPGTFGPVTTSLEADSPSGLAIDARTTGNVLLSSQKVSFTDFLLDVGVPGGLASAANPDVITFDELTLTNLLTGKSYLQTDWNMSQHYTGTGNQVTSLTGRGHRSNGDFYEIRTVTPQTTTPSGDVLGGQFTFTGAAGSQAIMTLVPGPTLQATMTVNGTPITNVPACQ